MVVASHAYADEPVAKPTPPPRTGFLDFNGYYDSREATGFTVNMLANLPASLQYFSLTNFVNANDARHLRDIDAFYSEQNLRWTPSASLPFALTTQWVVRGGEKNDAVRLGGLWRVSKTRALANAFSAIGLYYQVGLHAYQFDFIEAGGWRGQIEHVYMCRPLKSSFGSRFYVSGFVDHNLWLQGPSGTKRSRILTEHQLGVRVAYGLHVVTELRYNPFLADERLGLAVGLQYMLRFQDRN